jgi:capsular exopolysaccharide synthesis family protein
MTDAEAGPFDVYTSFPPQRRALTIFGVAALLWRRRWFVALVALLAMVITIFICKRLPPTYTADGAIVVASRKISIPEVEGALVTPTGDAAFVRSEMAVLRSRSVLRKVAAKLKLDQIPEFNPRLRPPDDSILTYIDPRRWLSRLIGHPPSSGANEREQVEAYVEGTLRRNLSVVNEGRDYVIAIHYRSQNPTLSAAIVNALMQTYLSQNAAAAASATLSANTSLNARAEELHRDLSAAERKVQDFTKRTGLVETNQGTVSAQQLADLNTQLAHAQADLATADAQYRQALAVERTGGSAASQSEVLASPLIQKLRSQEAEVEQNRADLITRVGPQHPDLKAANRQLQEIRAAIRIEIDKIAKSLKGQVEVMRAREASLHARVMRLRKAAATGAQIRDELQRLKNDVASKRKAYDDFLVRVAETAKPGDKPLPDARIVSAAVAPIHPSGPRTLPSAMLAGFIGALLGIAGALIYDQLDHGIETLEQAQALMGLPGLAALPGLRRFGRRSLSHRYVVDNPTSPFAETLRALRSRLRLASAGAPIKSLLVTSAVPGEGKTSFALGFARLAARDGYKVLLLECDFRRPVLDRVLPARTGAGRPDFVKGPDAWREWIGVDPLTGLHYVTVPRASEVNEVVPLLEVAGLETFMREASLKYDFVVIDSPPIMRVHDAILLSRYADAVLFVVWWLRTPQYIVREALRRLSLYPTKLAGIVLTKVQGRSQEGMYGGYSR